MSSLPARTRRVALAILAELIHAIRRQLDASLFAFCAARKNSRARLARVG